MFKEFFIKELGSALMRPMIYIFTLLMALAGALMVIFGEDIGSTGNVHVNSPHTISSLIAGLSMISLLISTAFFNNAALRDYKYNFNEILFSTPIKKNGYYFGRFFGALLLSTVPLCGIYIGFLIGAEIGPLTGQIEADRIGPFFFENFINSYLLFILPNMFFSGAIIFAIATKWKNTIISFLGTIVIVVASSIAGTLTSDIDNETIAGLTDIFGAKAFSIDSKYFTPNDKNEIGVTFSGILLMNRILWSIMGAIIMLLSYLSFEFISKNQKVKKEKTVKGEFNETTILTNPTFSINFSASTSITQFFSFFKLNFLSITRSNLFKILFVICAVMLTVNLWGGFDYMGLKSYPVTYKMMETVNGIAAFFVLIILVFFSGELVWRDRDSHINEVIDATPHSSIYSLIAKTLSLVGVGTILNLFFIGAAIIYQLLHGYTKLEIGVYLQDFIYSAFPMYIIWSCVFVFIQILINNKYLGYFISILVVFLLDIIFLILEIETNMLSIGAGTSYTYSDMNGFGSGLLGNNWFNLYWILFGALILSISGLIWVRGTTFGFKNRIKSIKKHLTPKYTLGLVVISILWMATASFVYYNTKILNSYESNDQREADQIRYEKELKKYEGIPQPKIISAKYMIDIYPTKQNFLAKSGLILENQTDQPIDSLHFITDESWNMKLHLKNAKIVFEDKELGYVIYQLDKALKPSEKMILIVEAAAITKGFQNQLTNQFLVENGTFINNFEILPSIGYSDSYELDDKQKRKKNGLPEKDRMPKLEKTCSSNSCSKNYLSNGTSDWINVETYISTSSDQIAIAPGSLIKEWKKDDRNYYHYKVDHVSQNFFNFMSARYEVARKKWNGIDIEIYYDKAHAYNVDKMIDAVEKSLKYYTENFGPYYHKQARILEFPRYSTFAQAFPGTMPYSESFGFITNLENESDNNVIDAVIAHEMAHQWWAHQVVGATMQGATMFSESFAEYSSLMVMKNKVKDDMKMKNFLKYDYDRYLTGRAFEQQKELPLYEVENQQYIHYGKGSVILYALQDYIGEEKVNNAMKSFLEEYRYAKPPYPTSLDFLRHLETQVPDSLNYLITDWFKEITLYDYRLIDANYSKKSNGKYEVTMNIEAYKLKADTLGKETNVDVNDWADIGVYADNDEENLMFYKRVKFDQEKMNFTFEVDSLPVKAAIDPRRILIERNIKDNAKTVTEVK